MVVTMDHTCYTHLLWLLIYRPKEFSMAVSRYECTLPNFETEGMTGYLECKLYFEIKNIKLFAQIWDEWYTAPERQSLYSQIVGSKK